MPPTLRSGRRREGRNAAAFGVREHTYTAEDLRFAYVGAEVLLPYGLSLRDGPLSADGSWSTASPDHDPTGPETTIVLAIETLAGRPSFGIRSLRVYADGGELVLATQSTNPEVLEQHVFRRD